MLHCVVYLPDQRFVPMILKAMEIRRAPIAPHKVADLINWNSERIVRYREIAVEHHRQIEQIRVPDVRLELHEVRQQLRVAQERVIETVAQFERQLPTFDEIQQSLHRQEALLELSHHELAQQKQQLEMMRGHEILERNRMKEFHKQLKQFARLKNESFSLKNL